LKAYTKNAAYLLWKEQEIGSLKEGKIADIVVFEDDFLCVADDALKDVRVYMTIANGETVYQLEQ
jgi:predicted amidohydrolase YtcJ